MRTLQHNAGAPACGPVLTMEKITHRKVPVSRLTVPRQSPQGELALSTSDSAIRDRLEDCWMLPRNDNA